MIRTNLIVIILFSLASIGCNSTPTPYQLENADYGPKPDYALAKRFAEGQIKSRLKDPASAQFTWGNLEKSWFKARGHNSKIRYAWRLLVGVNAKNSYGGYTGQKAYQFFYRGNKIVGRMSPDDLSPLEYNWNDLGGIDWGDNDDLPKEPPPSR